MSEKKDQKLNLPKTSIPMKASLNLREPEMLSEWDKRNVYKKIRKIGKEKKNLFFTMGHHMQMAIFTLGMLSIKFLKIL